MATGESPFECAVREIGEETAVEAMRNGASDYLLKSNLARLTPALQHAVRAAQRGLVGGERQALGFLWGRSGGRVMQQIALVGASIVKVLYSGR